MGRIGWEPAGGREEEEARRPVPRAKGGSRVNFLSVKTPLEREKCRCLLLVILGREDGELEGLVRRRDIH